MTKTWKFFSTGRTLLLTNLALGGVLGTQTPLRADESPSRAPSVVEPASLESQLLSIPLAKYEPAANTVYHGVSLPEVWSDTGLRQQMQQFQSASGKKVAIMRWFASVYESGRMTSWKQNYLPNLLRVRRLGAVSFIEFSTQDYAFEKTKKQADLRQIANGAWDAYFREAASAIKGFGSPVFISLDHEMNAPWYPYAQAYWPQGKPEVNVAKKGVTPSISGSPTAANYVAAWRHIVNLFQREGASNVAWVWAPHVVDVGGIPAARYYPGDAYVDWVGVSLASSVQPQELDGLYASYAERKPFFITEWATSEATSKFNRKYPGDAAWTTQFFQSLETRYPRIKAIAWFEWQKSDGDFRLERIPAQQSAYAQQIKKARYLDEFTNTAPTEANSLEMVPQPTPAPPVPGGLSERLKIVPLPENSLP